MGSKVHFHSSPTEHMHKSDCEWAWNGSIDPPEVHLCHSCPCRGDRVLVVFVSWRVVEPHEVLFVSHHGTWKDLIRTFQIAFYLEP